MSTNMFDLSNFERQMSSEIDELDNLFENLTFWRHSKLSSIGINVYDHSYFLSAEGETTTITIMVRPKNTARKLTSPKKVES